MTLEHVSVQRGIFMFRDTVTYRLIYNPDCVVVVGDPSDLIGIMMAVRRVMERMGLINPE